MAAFGLVDGLGIVDTIYDEPNNTITISQYNHYVPGFWVIVAALAKLKMVQQDSFVIAHQQNKGYATAMGLERALWGEDQYQYIRQKEGENYSTLVHLDRPESTDLAASTINDCIRNLITDVAYSEFVIELCRVVSDLLDNIWSHGKASGFSMAQKWHVPYSGNDSYLEFAVADCGLGLLGELHRVGMSEIQSDVDAIEICIQEGFSTKRHKPQDDWAQRMPEDVMNNPLRGIEQIKTDENHHMGLGLFNLLKLIEKFSGKLWLVSGESTLYVDENGNKSYINNNRWQGVAIACRFNTATLYSKVSGEKAVDTDVERIMSYIGGQNV